MGVDCIVAPYEADAQLAYLNRAGYADLIITEDSDLLLFGCKQVGFYDSYFPPNVTVCFELQDTFGIVFLHALIYFEKKCRIAESFCIPDTLMNQTVVEIPAPGSIPVHVFSCD